MKRVPIPTASEIMERRVHTISADMPLEDGVRSLLAKKHSGAPVVDSEGRLVGVLSEHDCVAALAQAAAEEWDAGKVSGHMTTEMETVPPTEDLFSLATRFSRGRHRRLLVVQDGKIVGLISRRDLLRALTSVVDALAQEPRASTYDLIDERHRKLD